MKRLLILVLMVLVTSMGFAQARPSFDQIAPGTGKFADGTAAAPSVTFGSDPDTGLYRYGANEIGFSSNGAYAGRIASGGRLILGTTTDDGVNKLQVNGGVVQNHNTNHKNTMFSTSDTVANNAVYTPLPFEAAGSNVNAVLLVTDRTHGYSAKFWLYGGGGVIEEQDPSNKFSVTADTATSLNIYVSGSNLVVQNKSGGSVNIAIRYFGYGG